MKSKISHVEDYETKTARKLVTLRLHPYTVELLKKLEESSGKNKTTIIETAIWISVYARQNPLFKTEDSYRSFQSKWQLHLQRLRERFGPRFLNEMESLLGKRTKPLKKDDE